MVAKWRGPAEVRGSTPRWARLTTSIRSAKAWAAVTHAMGGLFCAGLGPSADGESVTTFGGIYPPHVESNGELQRAPALIADVRIEM
jgi:hypothetical protein